MLLTGNIMVDGRYLEKPGNVIIDPDWAEPDPDAFRAWTASVDRPGTQFWAQLSHPGRQAHKAASTRTVSASDVSLPSERFSPTRPITGAEIDALVERFVFAADFALSTGFTGVQIHAAHGYLVLQFLSPLTNRRTDSYGGSLENRARLLLRIVERVRAIGSGFALSVKLNSADFQKGGFDAEDAQAIVGCLAARGVDLVELSGGNAESVAMMTRAVSDAFVPDSTKAREAYFLEFAETIGGESGVPIMLTGGSRTPAAMEAALAGGSVDVIGLARPFCDDPDTVTRLVATGGPETDGRDLETELAPHTPLGLSPQDRFGWTLQAAHAVRAMGLVELAGELAGSGLALPDYAGALGDADRVRVAERDAFRMRHGLDTDTQP